MSETPQFDDTLKKKLLSLPPDTLAKIVQVINLSLNCNVPVSGERQLIVESILIQLANDRNSGNTDLRERMGVALSSIHDSSSSPQPVAQTSQVPPVTQFRQQPIPQNISQATNNISGLVSGQETHQATSIHSTQTPNIYIVNQPPQTASINTNSHSSSHNPTTSTRFANNGTNPMSNSGHAMRVQHNNMFMHVSNVPNINNISINYTNAHITPSGQLNLLGAISALHPGSNLRTHSTPTIDLVYKENIYYSSCAVISSALVTPKIATPFKDTIRFRIPRKCLFTTYYPPPIPAFNYYAIQVFCTPYTITHSGYRNIEFPPGCRLFVNDKQVKWNFSGKKNHENSVAPPDITSLCNIFPHCSNQLVIFYPSSDKPYIFSIHATYRTSSHALTQQIFERRHLQIPQLNQSEDNNDGNEEIIHISQTISLKCPLTLVRIVTPIRSIHCKHSQCFDAWNFYQMYERTPAFICPVCYLDFKDHSSLYFDNKFKSILEHPSTQNLDHVYLDNEGNWSIESPISNSTNENAKRSVSALDLNNDTSSTALSDSAQSNKHPRSNIDNGASNNIDQSNQSNFIDLTMSDD